MRLVEVQGHHIQITGGWCQLFYLHGFVVSEFDAPFRTKRQDANVLPICVLVPVHSMIGVLESIAKDKGYVDIKVLFDFGTDCLEFHEAIFFIYAPFPIFLLRLFGILIAIVFIRVLC